MLRTSILLTIIIGIGLAGEARAQKATNERSRELAAALDKEKYKKKESKYVSIELYIDIKNEPASPGDTAQYSGSYRSDGCSSITLMVSTNGDASASGIDCPTGDGHETKFELRNGHIDGALLTGTKIYENGETRKFEAVFVNRTVRTGKNKDHIENSETAFGLGFIESGPVISGGTDKTSDWTSRVFMEKTR